MAKQSERTYSTSSLHYLCLCKLIEEFDHYSPEMLSLLPPVLRKELLLYCPVVSICHLEETSAFDGIDSDMFWDELLRNQNNRPRFRYNIKALQVLLNSCDYENYYSSNRKKYFTFLTAIIFSGDRFSGHYGQPYFKGDTPPPEKRSCPVDIVNNLVTYRKPDVAIEEVDKYEQVSKTDSSSETECSFEIDSSEEEMGLKSFFPIPIRNMCGRDYGELYEDATKGQHVHSRYSHYILKENHYRLSDEDAVALMMNECNYYPKKLLIHEYEHMHWKWSNDELVQLLTHFFSKLESVSLYFRQGNLYDCMYGNTINSDSNKGWELVLHCCFSSPVLSSIEIFGPVADDKTECFSTLITKPCPSLKMLDIDCWSDARSAIYQFEAFASIIASCSQLTEIRLELGTDPVAASSSCLYTSLINFVQRPEFSKLTLHVNLSLSSHLQLLLNAFLKTPCSQPQEIHLYSSGPPYGGVSPVCLPIGDNKVPSGALEYKSLFIHESCQVTVEFCEWLCSHQPLVLKAFHFDADLVNIGEYGTLAPPETAFPMQLLCDNALFQTQELILPIFHEFPSQVLQNLLQHQQLTVLSLSQPENFQQAEKPKPWNINAITSILSLQSETLTELTISSMNYHILIELSADIKCFGDTLFSLRNYEIFSLCIPVLWKAEDDIYIDSLYNSWLKHGCRQLKLFKMGSFEYGFVLTDELAMKLDKMGLVIQQTYVHFISSPSVSARTSTRFYFSLSSSSSSHTFSASSLHNLCLSKLIEDFHYYSPEMLSLLSPVQRKELLLYCPLVSICHLEQTCAFDGIDSDIFWDELILRNQSDRTRFHYNIKAFEVLYDFEAGYSSYREKYFTFLTAMIFSGDRFSGHYANGSGGIVQPYYKGGTLLPEKRSCPVDSVNYLVAYRKPDVAIKKVDRIEQFSEVFSSSETDSSEEDIKSLYSIPIRNMCGREYGKFYEDATKGQYVHSCYSHYSLKENHYRLSDEDAVALMMNECNYYPKKLLIHEYEHVYWKWGSDELMQLLTQFFSKLESISLYFKRKVNDSMCGDTTISDSKDAFELVLSCCFSSPVLSSLVIAGPVVDDKTAIFSTLTTKPCLSLKMLDINCWSEGRNKVCQLEPFARIIASCSQLTEINLHLKTDLEVAASSFSFLYTSLTSFVQRPEFSKLTLHGKFLPFSHLQHLLDAFLKTPCSQPQEIHLYPSDHGPLCSGASSVCLPIGENKIPSGALEYKSLFIHESCQVTVDFCEWLS